MTIIKTAWTITSVSVMIAALALAIAFCIASGSILKEDVAARAEMTEKVDAARLYARDNCDHLGSIKDPKNRNASMRQLYRCPAYQRHTAAIYQLWRNQSVVNRSSGRCVS